MTLPPMLQALQRHAARAPWHPFLVIRHDGHWMQFSYADALAETEAWAGRIASLRLPAGSVLCIAIPHAPELYFLFLAAVRAGLVPSFLAYATPKQQPAVYWSGMAEFLGRTKPGALVVEPQHLDIVQSLATPGCLVTTVGALRGHEPDAVPEGAPVSVDAITLLQHSSGTTGAKKGVALTHAQIARQVDAYGAAIAITPADRIVSWLPLYHDMGLVTGFLLPLAAGATVVALDAFDWVATPSLLFEAIELVQGTLAWLPNFAFGHMVRVNDPARRFALQSMRAFISCSEPCKPETMESFATCFASSGVRPGMLHTCYAMAEAVFAATQSPLDEAPPVLWFDRDALQRQARTVKRQPEHPDAVPLLSCGRPIQGMAVAIGAPGLDDEGAVGEILLKADYLFGNYHQNPEATERAFIEGWYRTGDQGFLHGGHLFVCGRLKEVIIVHGRNFYAHDVEAAIGEVDGVKAGRVGVFGRFSVVSGSEEIVAIAELRSAITGLDALDELRRRIRQHVFDRLELTIRTIELCSPGTLVKTTSGKISRQAVAGSVPRNQLLDVGAQP